MEAIQGWIVSITATALLTMLCRSLMLPGAAKRVGGMVCALLLFTVLVAPVKRLDLEGLEEQLSRWAEQYEDDSPALEETDRALESALIAEQCEAYLEDRARALGGSCTAQVECERRESLTVPVSVTLATTLTGAEREQLRGAAVSDLGIEPSQVHFAEEEGP